MIKSNMNSFNHLLCLCIICSLIILLFTTPAIADERIDVEFDFGSPSYYSPNDSVRLSTTIHDVSESFGDVREGEITNIEIIWHTERGSTQTLYSGEVEERFGGWHGQRFVEFNIAPDVNLGQGNISVVVKYSYYKKHWIRAEGALKTYERRVSYKGEKTYNFPFNIISDEEKAKRDAEIEAQKPTWIELVFGGILFILPFVIIALIIRWIYRKLK